MTLIGAAVGSGLGLLHAAFIDNPYSGDFYVPQTMAGWMAYYLSYALPWALVGATVGFAFAHKKSKAGREGERTPLGCGQ
jgi:hypothetical protein